MYKRNNIWVADFIFSGERYQRSTRTGDRRLADKIEAQMKALVVKGEFGLVEKSPAPMLGAFAPKFKEFISVRNASKPNTIRFYEEKLRRLLDFEPLMRSRLDAIDERLIETYVQKRIGEVKPASINLELATLRLLLGLANEWKLIDRIPRVRKLSGIRGREFVLSHKLEAAYLAACPQPLKDLAVLMLDTGLRIGEALSLKWSDVRLQQRETADYDLVTVRDGKTANAQRTIRLTRRASEMLETRPASTPFVFTSRSGNQYKGTSIDHLHAKARSTIGLSKEFVVHSLRHTFLTRLGESGADVFAIMKIAGHSSVTVSQKYIHPSSEHLERALRQFQQVTENARRDMSNPETIEVPAISTAPRDVSFVSY